MREIVAALVEHVRRLEPHLNAQTLLLDLRLDRNGSVYHRAGHITEGSTAPGPRPLAYYLELEPCTVCLPTGELFAGLLQSIDDRNLNRAAQILHELTAIRDELELRGGEPVQRTGEEDRRLAALDELAVRFLTDSIILTDSRQQLLANPVLPQHHACTLLAEELIARLHHDICNKLRTEANVELLRRHIEREFAVTPDTTPTLVQLAPSIEVPSFGDHGFLDEADGIDAHANYLPLTLRVLYGHETLLDEALVTMPHWAAQTIRLLKPTSLRSSLHRALPPKVAETAAALWSPSPEDLYHQLDHCVTAAHRLVGEEHPRDEAVQVALGHAQTPRP